MGFKDSVRIFVEIGGGIVEATLWTSLLQSIGSGTLAGEGGVSRVSSSSRP